MRSHTDADQVTRINNVRIPTLQINRLHRIHMVNIDPAVDGIISMAHIESVVSDDDFVSD